MSNDVLISEWGSWDEFMGEPVMKRPTSPPPTSPVLPSQTPPTTLPSAQDALYQEIADKYEELQEMYRRHIPNPRITDDQLACIRKLLKDMFLFKADFADSHQFHKKKKMTMVEADRLIKLGIHRQKEWNLKRQSTLGQRWKI